MTQPAHGASAVLAERGTTRLVPAAHVKPPVLDALVDTDAERAILEDLEGETSRRLALLTRGPADLDPRELAFSARDRQLRRWGTTYVNAAFVYTRRGGNRFNDEARGAWYCAFDALTAIAEVGYHRTRELAFIDHFYDEAVYQALLADFIGEFADLRGPTPPPSCLDPDPAIGYAAGQRLARRLREAGHRGLVYPSVRQRGGTCLVAFEPQAVQNVRPGATWRLRWSGSEHYEVCANV